MRLTQVSSVCNQIQPGLLDGYILDSITQQRCMDKNPGLVVVIDTSCNPGIIASITYVRK